MANRLAKRVAAEWLLILTILGWCATSLYLRRFPHYSPTDFKVVYTLLVFLVSIKGLEHKGVLPSIAARLDGGAYLPQKLILITGLLSMFVTNDVAVLTMVPLTLALGMDERLIILEALVANSASTLTPFGNPQNIFIYFHYHLHPLEFMGAIAPFALFFFAFCLAVSFLVKKGPQALSSPEGKPGIQKAGLLYGAFFVIFVLAVLRILPLFLGILPLVFALIWDRESLKVDYLLLLTFLAFFGFTDNLMHILRFSLGDGGEVFLYSALGSQVISNFPSTLLFADFTRNWQALLWGVSVGGFGNLISSLASLIAYRLYKAHTGEQKSFLVKFHILGYTAFALGCGLFFLVIS